MDKLIKYLLSGTVFFVMMCVDFSSMCKHVRSAEKVTTFAYRQDKYYGAGKELREQAQKKLTEKLIELDERAVNMNWEQLLDLSFIAKYNKEYDLDLLYPVFGNKIKKLSGKKVQISGYMIPLDIKEGIYAISKFTYASCFFCGGAGVESVISLKFKNKPRKYRTDEFCTIQGILELNDTDVNDFIYLFKEAEELKNK
ncbi:hypothetical protein [Gynurincola endophyticus]|uniref:hypothetical protein n=1 Tax=Gynurincola endophyticus TaxID=2479004 RepID=UPI000F8EB1FC|nr:hypothetical protein [Gynurincola endophyticus]